MGFCFTRLEKNIPEDVYGDFTLTNFIAASKPSQACWPVTEASCRHFWTMYRKGRQQAGNTHCTSLLSGTRMKYTFYTVEFFWLPASPASEAITTDTSASGEVLSLSHFVFLHQQSFMPPLLAVQPLLSSLPLSHLLQTSSFLTWSYHPYICYSSACLLFSPLPSPPQGGFFDYGVLRIGNFKV